MLNFNLNKCRERGWIEWVSFFAKKERNMCIKRIDFVHIKVLKCALREVIIKLKLYEIKSSMKINN